MQLLFKSNALAVTKGTQNLVHLLMPLTQTGLGSTLLMGMGAFESRCQMPSLPNQGFIVNTGFQYNRLETTSTHL